MIAVASNGTDAKTRLEVLREEVSASRLGLWSSCRLKFYFKYVAQVQRSATPSVACGQDRSRGPTGMESGPVERSGAGSTQCSGTVHPKLG